MPAKSDYDNHRKYTFGGRKSSQTKCDGCAKVMEGRRYPVVVAQIEPIWFRGDDIVHFFHPECWAGLPEKPSVVKK